MKYKEFKPEWNPSIEGFDTYRAKMKWGNPEYFSEPSEALYIFIKEKLNLSDEDFITPTDMGLDKIEYAATRALSDSDILEFEAMLGKINVKKDVVSRVNAAYGKGVYDNLRLRDKIIENIPDVVLTPVNEEQIVSIMKYCISHDIALYPSGGRTNCNRSTECFCGGVCLDLMQNYNKIISFSESDQTVTVMSGITGPQVEEFLNNIGDYFPEVAYRYTLGHVPQSFEFSTVGGWVMSRSKGNNSTMIGGIDNILLSARYITPRGIIDTSNCSKLIPLPSVDELFIGSNGAFGILLSVTLKVRRYSLDGKKQFSYMFPNMDSAIKFVKEVCQGDNGLPYSMLLCDPERTDMILRMHMEENGIFAPFLREMHKNSSRCLVMGSLFGQKTYTSMVKRYTNRTSAEFGGRNATGFITKNWERTQFNNAYVSDMFMDYGVIMDRIDCRVPWSKVEQVYAQIKSIIEERPHTLAMANINHITSHNCSLQFDYVAKFDSIFDYNFFTAYLREAVEKVGVIPTINYAAQRTASLSDGAFMTSTQNGLFGAIKKYLDPYGIMRRNEMLSAKQSPKSKKRQSNNLEDNAIRQTMSVANKNDELEENVKIDSIKQESVSNAHKNSTKKVNTAKVSKNKQVQ